MSLVPERFLRTTKTGYFGCCVQWRSYSNDFQLAQDAGVYSISNTIYVHSILIIASVLPLSLSTR